MCAPIPASGADRRTLEQTQRWLGELGYTCFLQTSFDLAPISGPCWRAEFERRHWSNVLCAGREAELSLLYNISAEGKARRLLQILAVDTWGRAVLGRWYGQLSSERLSVCATKEATTRARHGQCISPAWAVNG